MIPKSLVRGECDVPTQQEHQQQKRDEQLTRGVVLQQSIFSRLIHRTVRL